jgi:hypothetical protein
MTPRHYGNKQPTKAALRTALGMILVMRERLDNVDCAGLARSYGVTEQDVADMVAAERMRRVQP